MAKILILKPDVNLGEEYDIWDKCSNDEIFNRVCETSYKSQINYGNKLWFQSLISMISSENELVYFNNNMSYDYINEYFDMVIYPMANIFNSEFNEYIYASYNWVKNFKIPVYVIACGMQKKSNETVIDVVNKIGESSKRFIDSVYNTGGEFALRGYITKDFFDKLGPNTAVVTGCPSIYQMGRNLAISNNKVTEKEFKPLFNGKIGFKYCNLFKDSAFIDQDVFFKYIYDDDFIFSKNSKDVIFKLIKEYGYFSLKLLCSNRVKLFVSMNEWYNFIKMNKYNFSFGSRIHGNIMPILAGVPSLIYPNDTRVREMAEFYSIPFLEKKHKMSMYDLYLNCDYSRFNEEFPKRFDDFEKFLQSFGIVKKINQKNMFLFDKDFDFENINAENLDLSLNEINKFKYKMYNELFNIKKRIF